MLLDMDFKFKSLDGKEIDEEASKSLASFLCFQNTSGISSIKATDWALKLYSDGKIEIDNADLDLLDKLIEESQFTNLGKYQLRQAIKKCKE